MSVQRNTSGFPMPKAGKDKNPFSKKGTIPVDDLEQYKTNPKKKTTGKVAAKEMAGMERAAKGSKRLVVNSTPDDLNDGDDRPTKAKTKGGGSDVNPFDSIAKDLLASNRKEDAKWTQRPADEPEAEDDSVQSFKKSAPTKLKGDPENDDWIENAKIKKGTLHRELDVPEGDKIPASKIDKAVKSKNSKLRKRAQFAKNMESR